MSAATCHPDKKSFGRGLCKPCYTQAYYRANKTKIMSNAKKRWENGGKEAWELYYSTNRERILFRQREYRERNKVEINRKQQLNWSRYKYGITLEEVNRLLINQDNKCIGCLREFDDKLYPCVDHSHTTNKVRGILCDPCNKSLGILLDSSNTLRRLADYLDKNKQ